MTSSQQGPKIESQMICTSLFISHHCGLKISRCLAHFFLENHVNILQLFFDFRQKDRHNINCEKKSCLLPHELVHADVMNAYSELSLSDRGAPCQLRSAHFLQKLYHLSCFIMICDDTHSWVHWAHCASGGHRLDLGSQRKFQQIMKI